ncbi:hypothetical protein [Serratia microhaemolytica]|uniref:hypothetical protein n=1 Tax=Serratia microhaemolytica TaxID=2675110 RepID=UPI001F0BDBC8|nr:hypothetical protein [Serratia microhaemolytica]
MKYNLLFLSAVLLTTAGCAQLNKELNPPSDNTWIEIEIKAPEHTQAFPVNALYTSEICKRDRLRADMKIYKITGTKARNITMSLENDTGLYRAKIPRNGGGGCQWQLSRVTFGIEYASVEHLVKNGEVTSGVGVNVAFSDGYGSSEFIDYPVVSSPLTLSPIYYPVIIEWRFSKQSTDVDLFGQRDFDFYKIRLKEHEGAKITFLPQVDESKVVRSIGPKEKKEGNHWRIIYPDGSETYNGEVFPNYNRVKAM